MSDQESDPKLSRRSVITAGLRSGEEIALLSAFSIYALSTVLLKPPLPLHEVGYTPNTPNRLTNVTHPNLQGGHIHNIGVAHVKPFFDQHQEFFRQAIADCDALLLEGNPFSYPEYKDPSAKAFFEKCHNVAVENTKTIYFIDDIRSPLLFYQGIFAVPSMPLIALVMNLDTQDELIKCHHTSTQGTPSALPLFSTRRNFLRLLAGIALGSASVTHMPNADTPEEYDGYIFRGRSAIMMRNILTIANAAPFAKLLTITGNIHAELFEHYFADPALFQRDLNDYRVHDAIYSLPVKKMEPGDRRPHPFNPA